METVLIQIGFRIVLKVATQLKEDIMVYVAEVKTAAGVYFRFYETTKLTKRTETVQAVGVKPYSKISATEFQVEPDLNNHYGPEFRVQKNGAGLYIEGNGKKGLQKTYLTEGYNANKKYINIFDKSKLQ